MAVSVDRVDRQLVARIGSAEQKPPGPVGHDIGHAVLQRRRREVGQPATRPVDRKARRRKRVAAQRGYQKPAIRGHRHRHAGRRGLVGAGHRDLVEKGQLAALTVHREDVDFLACGTRHIDDRIRHRIGHGFASSDQRAGQRYPAEPQCQHSPARRRAHLRCNWRTARAAGRSAQILSHSATFGKADMSICAGRAQARMPATLRSATVNCVPSR